MTTSLLWILNFLSANEKVYVQISIALDSHEVINMHQTEEV
jgi:hypothetical protein